jgi:hypothetical protein
LFLQFLFSYPIPIIEYTGLLPHTYKRILRRKIKRDDKVPIMRGR